MRTNAYIPVTSTADWVVRLCTGGNYDITQTNRGIYRFERILLWVNVRAVATTKTVRISSTSGKFPSIDYEVPNPSSADAEVTIDLTPYADYLGSETVVSVVELNSLSTALSSSLIIRNGIHPHSLINDSMDICTFTGGGGLGDDIKMYGHLPRVVNVGDMVEVSSPICLYKHADESESAYGTRYSLAQAVISAMVRAWSLKTPAGVIEAASRISRSVQMNNAGVFRLYGCSYVWAADSVSYTSYTDVPTGEVIRVEPQDGCRDQLRLQWRSRTGNDLSALWDVIKHKDATQDEVQLQTISGEYAGYKGGTRSVLLRKSKLNAFEVWYYASVISSNYVRAEINGQTVDCKMLTKNATIPTSDVGQDYDLEVEIQYNEYDAI